MGTAGCVDTSSARWLQGPMTEKANILFGRQSGHRKPTGRQQCHLSQQTGRQILNAKIPRFCLSVFPLAGFPHTKPAEDPRIQTLNDRRPAHAVPPAHVFLPEAARNPHVPTTATWVSATQQQQQPTPFDCHMSVSCSSALSSYHVMGQVGRAAFLSQTQANTRHFPSMLTHAGRDTRDPCGCF